MGELSEQLCERVLAALQEAEAEARRFARSARLACPAGCGWCCVEGRPEDSLLSALPAAREAVRLGAFDRLAEAAERNALGPCVFYDPRGPGHCSLYAVRPLVCRLFGFAGQRDKRGRVRFRPCRRMRAPAGPCACTPPVFSDHAMRLEGIYPPLGQVRAPLNVAFYRAAEWLMLHQSFERPGPATGPTPGPRPARGRAA